MKTNTKFLKIELWVCKDQVTIGYPKVKLPQFNFQISKQKVGIFNIIL